MEATSYPDVNRMLDLILDRISAALPSNLIGLYLSGSLVAGDFDELVSDIDLAAVTATGLSEQEVERLGAMHRAIALAEPTWDNRIEVAYISVDALKTFRERTSTIGITSPGEPFHTLEAGKDWLINWYNVRERGIVLFGPPATNVIGPIAKDEAVQWVREHVEHWRSWRQKSVQHRNAQIYATLTLCRTLHTITTGRFVSKRQAASWTAQELPEWSALIEDALRGWREDWYKDDVDPEATWDATLRFVEVIVEKVSRTKN
jgi:hypothetical protein